VTLTRDDELALLVLAIVYGRRPFSLATSRGTVHWFPAR
jgi:hypothetical protein